MKTWTLVWLLIFPPTEDGSVPFEKGEHRNLTDKECVQMLAEADLQYLLMEKEGLIAGHIQTCTDSRGNKVTVTRRHYYHIGG